MKSTYLFILLFWTGALMAQQVSSISTSVMASQTAVPLTNMAILDTTDDGDGWEGLLLGTNTCLGASFGESNTNLDLGLGIVGQYNINEQFAAGGIVNFHRNGSTFDNPVSGDSRTTQNSVMVCPFFSYYPSCICDDPESPVKPFTRFQAGLGVGNLVSEFDGSETVINQTRLQASVGIGATVNFKEDSYFNIWSDVAHFSRVTDRFQDTDFTSSSNNLFFGLNKPTIAVELMKAF